MFPRTVPCDRIWQPYLLSSVKARNEGCDIETRNKADGSVCHSSRSTCHKFNQYRKWICDNLGTFYGFGVDYTCMSTTQRDYDSYHLEKLTAETLSKMILSPQSLAESPPTTSQRHCSFNQGRFGLVLVESFGHCDTWDVEIANSEIFWFGCTERCLSLYLLPEGAMFPWTYASQGRWFWWLGGNLLAYTWILYPDTRKSPSLPWHEYQWPVGKQGNAELGPLKRPTAYRLAQMHRLRGLEVFSSFKMAF